MVEELNWQRNSLDVVGKLKESEVLMSDVIYAPSSMSRCQHVPLCIGLEVKDAGSPKCQHKRKFFSIPKYLLLESDLGRTFVRRK